MNKTKITAIKAMEQIKSGVRNDNTTWEMVRVIDIDGDRYATFEPERCGKFLESGEDVEITFTETPSEKKDKQGNPYMNRELVSVRPAPSADLAALKHDIERLKAAMVEAGIIGAEYFGVK